MNKSSRTLEEKGTVRNERRKDLRRIKGEKIRRETRREEEEEKENKDMKSIKRRRV